MSRHRRRVWLVTVLGLAVWLPACAPSQDPAVAYPRGAYYATTRFEPYWWHERVGIKASNDKGLTGKGSRVAIVDTGVLFGHEDLPPANLENGTEFCTGTEGKAEDRTNGHGTELAGIVGGKKDGLATRGVAYDATLIPYKVVCGTTNADIVARAVRRASAKSHVLLLALGPWPGDTDGNGKSLDELLDEIVGTNPDTLFVVGSVWDLEYYKRPDWTRRTNVILVAAMTLDEMLTREVPYNTKRGDIWAPGRDVATSSIDPHPNAMPHDRYLMQGTSAAAAIVAGCAALLQQESGSATMGGAALKGRLLRAVQDVGLRDGKRLQCDAVR